MTWTKCWSQISPKDFEELLYWILYREGFFNVTWYGEAGSDKGRDLVCERTELLGPRIVPCKCVVQCKRYSGRVNRQKIFEDLLKASEHKPDYFILATTGILGSSTKDWLMSHQQRFGVKIVVWERMELQILLERHQDLRAQYLNVEIEPNYFLKQLAHSGIELSNVDKLLVNPAACSSLSLAYELALQYGNLLTLGHIIVGLLKCDSECTRSIFIEIGVNIDEFTARLEECWVARQARFPTKRFGVRLSPSIPRIVEMAIKTMRVIGESVLSERVILRAVLSQRSSASLRFVTEAGVNLNALWEKLNKRFFEERLEVTLGDLDETFDCTKSKSGVRLSIGDDSEIGFEREPSVDDSDVRLESRLDLGQKKE